VTRAMPSRAREALLGLLLSAVSIAAVLLVLELTLRAFGFVPDRFQMMGRMANARWTLLLDCYPTNPRGYFDIDLRQPRSRERYFSVAPLRFDDVARRAPWAVESRYNALRFRDAPLGPKRPGVRRVMVLGDSFTEGQGVKEPDTCVRQLERLLNASEPGGWEVRNCGRRGTDFPALYQAFEEILPYEPDVLVYAMVLNDPEQSESFHARQTFVNDWILDRGHQTDDLQVEPSVFRSRLFTLVADRVTAWRVGRETTRWYLDMYGPPNREGWEQTQRYLREMNRRVQEGGGRFLLAPWPLFVGLEGGYPFAPIHETIRRFCLQAGIAHHDLLPVFRGRRSETLWVHPVDRHPNEIAHRLAAEDLAPVVRALGQPPSP
jgi:lysophospholipase L1-like esterase